jgi:GxxExxY protein
MTTPDRDPLTELVIGAAISVHRALGPGLLESVYEECLAYDLTELGLDVQRQLYLPIRYKKIQLEQAYRIDLLVNNRLIIEVKAIDALALIHDAQLLTYLRLTNIRTGLLINFQVALLKDGIKRLVL